MKIVGELEKIEVGLSARLGALTGRQLNSEMTLLCHGQKFPSGICPDNLLLIGKHLSKIESLGFIIDQKVKHLLNCENLSFCDEIEFASEVISRRSEVFARPMEFLIKDESQSVRRESFLVTHSKQKTETLRQLHDLLKSVAGAGSMLDAIVLMADEMLMNALFNAPVDESGKPTHRDLARHSSVSVDQQTPIELFATWNDQSLVLGCVDPFGSLDVEKFFQRIYETYGENDTAAIRENAVGAGLGSRLIFEYSSCFYVGVLPGKKTLFAGKLPLRKGLRKALSQPKVVHIF